MIFKNFNFFIFLSFLSLINDINSVTPDQALSSLKEGNAQYIKGRISCPESIAKERKQFATIQHPFAIILGCSDSRVSPELLFNKLGLGNLFVIRNAGNVVDDVVAGSIEYGVKHLNSPLIMVLGHERCGAVTAAVDLKTNPVKIDHNIKAIVNKII